MAPRLALGIGFSLALLLGSPRGARGEELSCAASACASIPAGTVFAGTGATWSEALGDALNGENPNYCAICPGIGCIGIVWPSGSHIVHYEKVGDQWTATVFAGEGFAICTLCQPCIVPHW
jgi:hypothetical protein